MCRHDILLYRHVGSVLLYADNGLLLTESVTKQQTRISFKECRVPI